MKSKGNYTVDEALSICKMVEKSYEGTNSLIVKDLQDNVFFLCYGVYVVNGEVKPSTLYDLKNTFGKVVSQCKWCEFDGEIVDFIPYTTSPILFD